MLMTDPMANVTDAKVNLDRPARIRCGQTNHCPFGGIESSVYQSNPLAVEFQAP